MPLVPFGSSKPRTGHSPASATPKRGVKHRGSHDETREKTTAVSSPSPSMAQGAGIPSGPMPQSVRSGHARTSRPAPGSVSDGAILNGHGGLPKQVRGGVRRK